MTRTTFKIWTLELCALQPGARKLRFFALTALFLLISSTAANSYAQRETPERTPPPLPQPATRSTPRPPVVVKPVTPTPRITPVTPPNVWGQRRPGRRIHNEGEAPAEKSISTDAGVNINLCVSEGNVKINGWDRDEIRVFVDNGSEVGFVVRSKNRRSGKPDWLNIIGYDPRKNTEPGLDQCLAGEEIEIDVPRGAVINELIGIEATISIASVKRVKLLTNVGGNISLSDIAQGANATTREGDVTIERSAGTIRLVSTNGNVVAFETEANEIGDTFTAKTNSGAITLQGIGHHQVQTGSTSGSIRFNGELTSGGQYSFDTINGSISLAIPVESSCKIKATYGGSFNSEIPLQNIVNPTPSRPTVRTLTGSLGAGDASVSLTTMSGAIRIRKN